MAPGSLTTDHQTDAVDHRLLGRTTMSHRLAVEGKVGVPNREGLPYAAATLEMDNGAGMTTVTSEPNSRTCGAEMDTLTRESNHQTEDMPSYEGG
jgi:hypothetical protein